MLMKYRPFQIETTWCVEMINWEEIAVLMMIAMVGTVTTVIIPIAL